MVPHYSGTTLDAQARYAGGTKKILENYLTNKPQEPQNIIVGLGKLLYPQIMNHLLTEPMFLTGKYESKACKYSNS